MHLRPSCASSAGQKLPPLCSKAVVSRDGHPIVVEVSRVTGRIKIEILNEIVIAIVIILHVELKQEISVEYLTVICPLNLLICLKLFRGIR